MDDFRNYGKMTGYSGLRTTELHTSDNRITDSDGGVSYESLFVRATPHVDR